MSRKAELTFAQNARIFAGGAEGLKKPSGTLATAVGDPRGAFPFFVATEIAVMAHAALCREWANTTPFGE